MARARAAATKQATAKRASTKRASAIAKPKPATKPKPGAERATAKPKPAAKPKPGAKRAIAKPASAASKPSTHPLKRRSPADEALADRLRQICQSWPDVVEKIAWGEPTWRAGGKMFASLDTYHHGSAHLSVHLAAPPGAQAALIDSDPARFFRPPYVGGKGWVAIVLDTDPDWDMVEALVATARETVLSARRR